MCWKPRRNEKRRSWGSLAVKATIFMEARPEGYGCHAGRSVKEAAVMRATP
jgi:hypothetical protein